MAQPITVGRSVHYMSHGSPDGRYKPEIRLAFITAVGDHGTETEENRIVSLYVVTPTGTFHDLACPFSETYQPGHWSWQPRV